MMVDDNMGQSIYALHWNTLIEGGRAAQRTRIPAARIN